MLKNLSGLSKRDFRRPIKPNCTEHNYGSVVKRLWKGQDIRPLANLAYPTDPNDVRETLVKEQFIDGIMSVDMRLRIKQARPADLNDAISHPAELEGFNKAEIKQEGKGYSRAITRDGDTSDTIDKTKELLKNMQTALSDLQQEVKALKQTLEKGCFPFNGNSKFQNRKKRGCFNCGRLNISRKIVPKVVYRELIGSPHRDRKYHMKNRTVR
ncbi:unnamed protein product [Mytilus coruscus]|uniref:Uncharacterized protein n=1 Tax=Mytilus coruscus TaxID=42192 RepID=A0A6J8BAX2_MYTCO|nr:unnamed protein product [Mytilus coruscus]